jgi:glucose/arabinose dehydrogenase
MITRFLLPAAVLSSIVFLPAFNANRGCASGAGTPREHYRDYCASCHGANMEAFVQRRWVYGHTREALIKGIKHGYPEGGMPAYEQTFNAEEIAALADYIIENIKRPGAPAASQPATRTFTSAGMTLRLEPVVRVLDVPWGIAFPPEGGMLITERSGVLFHFTANGDLMRVEDVPEVVARNQGGLLDIILHPDYENNGWLYLSYSKPGDGRQSTTAAMRAKLRGNRLVEQQIIFEAQPYSNATHHFGSRFVFDAEGYLYLTVGDRGNHPQNPQSLANHCGKVHRLYDDGRIPDDNPFSGRAGAVPSIYSYGHRNPQGMDIHPRTGAIWTHEHGPRGGDEINIIRPGANYGWPVISYGINYDGTILTDKTEAPGMEQPELYWTPSIAPSGMAFVDSDRYPGWSGDDLLVGSLSFRYLHRCRLDGDKIVDQEKLLENIGRVRDVRMGPDGLVYIAVESPGMIYRILPEDF